MAEDLISSFVSPEGKAQLEATIAALERISNEITDINAQGIKFTQQTGSSGDLKTLTANLNAVTAAVDKLTQSQDAQTITTAKLNWAREESARKAAREAKAAEQAGSAYLKLSKEYNAAAREAQNLAAKDLAAGLAKSSAETLKAAENAKKLGDQLKTIDAMVGRHQRNVGNYKSAFEGLSMSMNQLTRELPSAVNGLNIFFLAISNNLPQMFDSIKKVREENERLAADGKKGASVMSQLGSALFSWQTALSVGVTLLTLYGKQIADWTVNMLKGGEAAEKAAKKQEEYNKQVHDTATGAAAAVVEMETLKARFYDANATIDDQKQVVKELNEKWGENIGQMNSVNDANDFFINRSDAFIEVMIQRAAITAMATEAAAKYVEKLDLLADPSKQVTGVQKFASYLATIDNMLAGTVGIITKEEQKKNEELQKQYRSGTMQTAHAVGQLETRQDELKKSIVATTKAMHDQMAAFGFTFDKAGKAKKTPKEKLSEYDKEAMAQFGNDLAAMAQSAGDAVYASLVDAERRALNQWKSDSKMWQDVWQDVLGYDPYSNFEEAGSAALKVWKTISKKVSDDDDKERQEKIKNIQHDIGEIVGQYSNISSGVFDIANMAFDNRMRQIEMEKDAINDLLEVQLAAIETSAATEDEKRKAKLDAEGNARAQLAALERKEADLKRKAAIADKAQAISEVIQNVAVGIASTLQYGPVAAAILSVLYAGIGAAQIAMISAQPIPQFYKGTDSAPEGLAWVGERGTELMIDPAGNVGFTPDSATLQYLKRGTQVIPHGETMEIVKNLAAEAIVNNALYDSRLIDAITGGNKALIESNRQIVQAINKHGLNGKSDVNFELYSRMRTNKM